MADIFISYKREEWDKIDPLVRALEFEKFEVWWDEKILPGERIAAAIKEVLDEVACVIVVWSKLAVESNWVPDEAGYVKDRDILIPITLDSSEAPLGFQQLLVQDLDGWQGDRSDTRFQKIVARVRELLARREIKAKSQDLTAELADAEPAHRRDLIRSRYAGIHNKRIFLIVGSFKEEWQVSLNLDLMEAAQRADLLCSVLVPFEDHSFDQQRSLLQSVQSRAQDYAGGIVICSGWPDHLMEELVALVSAFSIPVIFVDRNPPVPEREVLPKLTYLSVSDRVGGELAAEAVLELADTLSIRRILVIAGFAKSGRHKAFQEKLTNSGKLKGCEFVTTQDGKFDRWISENLAYNQLLQATNEAKPFDVVFCTADSMTLGCLDAIERLTRRKKMRKPRVIGYDGTVTTKSLVDSRQSPLTRVVIQDHKELAGAAIAQLIGLNQGDEKAYTKKVIWISPYLYPRLEKMSI